MVQKMAYELNEADVKKIKDLLAGQNNNLDRVNKNLVHTSNILSNISDNLYHLAHTLAPKASEGLRKFTGVVGDVGSAAGDAADGVEDLTKALEDGTLGLGKNISKQEQFRSILGSVTGFLSKYGVQLTAAGVLTYNLTRYLEGLKTASENVIASGAYQREGWSGMIMGAKDVADVMAYGTRRAAQFGLKLEDVAAAQEKILQGAMYGRVGTKNFQDDLEVLMYDTAAMSRTFGISADEIGKYVSDVHMQLGQAGKEGTDALYTLNHAVQTTSKQFKAGTIHGDMFAKSLMEFAADETNYGANLDKFAVTSVKGFELAHKAAGNHNLALKTSKELMKALTGQTADWLQTISGEKMLAKATENWGEFAKTLHDMTPEKQARVKDIVDRSKTGAIAPYEAMRLLNDELGKSEAGMRTMYETIRTTLRDAPIEAIQSALNLSSYSTADLVKQIAISGKGFSEFKRAMEEGVVKPSKEGREAMQDAATTVGLIANPLGTLGKTVASILNLPYVGGIITAVLGVGALRLGYNILKPVVGAIKGAVTGGIGKMGLGGYLRNQWNLRTGAGGGAGGGGAAVGGGGAGNAVDSLGGLGGGLAGKKTPIPVFVVNMGRGGLGGGGGRRRGGSGGGRRKNATGGGRRGAAPPASPVPRGPGPSAGGSPTGGGRRLGLGKMGRLGGIGALGLAASYGLYDAFLSGDDGVSKSDQFTGLAETGKTGLALGSLASPTAGALLKPFSAGAEVINTQLAMTEAYKKSSGGADTTAAMITEFGKGTLSALGQWFSLGFLPAEWTRGIAKVVVEESQDVMGSIFSRIAHSTKEQALMQAEKLPMPKTAAELAEARSKAKNLEVVDGNSSASEIMMAAEIQHRRYEAEAQQKKQQEERAEVNRKKLAKDVGLASKSLFDNVKDVELSLGKQDIANDTIEVSFKGRIHNLLSTQMQMVGYAIEKSKS